MKHYSDLCKVLKNTDLLPHFVTASVITPSELDEISAINSPAEKVTMFLRKISSPLEAGITISFYSLLAIMTSNGNSTTKELSVNMSKSLLSLHSDEGIMMYSKINSSIYNYIDGCLIYFNCVIFFLYKCTRMSRENCTICVRHPSYQIANSTYLFPKLANQFSIFSAHQKSSKSGWNT